MHRGLGTGWLGSAYSSVIHACGLAVQEREVAKLGRWT